MLLGWGHEMSLERTKVEGKGINKNMRNTTGKIYNKRHNVAIRSSHTFMSCHFWPFNIIFELHFSEGE